MSSASAGLTATAFRLTTGAARIWYFIGGGCGLAPIWPVITTAVAQRANFKNITVFYGGRTSRDIMYRAELEKLRESVDVHLSIDKAEEGWDGYCGFVPAAVMDKDPVPTTPSRSPADRRS